MDDYFLVLNKAPGLPVQPGSKHKDSVSSRLKNTFADNSFIPAPAHRIDQHCSGLILAGRTYQAQRYLHALFSEHKAELNRIYLVWVSGVWALPENTLFKDYLCLKRGADGFERMYTVPANTDRSHEAVADFRTLQILPDVIKNMQNEKDKSSATLLAVRLLTGRKHQIRVQCASRGHPVVGDPRYGGTPYARLLLHGCKISIPKADFLLSSPSHFVSRPDWLTPFNIQDEIWDSVNTYAYGC
jgi:23S rRNA pseudouridine955/2504/2580 synthase